MAVPPRGADRRFGELQQKLRAARWPMGDGRASRVVVSIPSINLDATVMSRHREGVWVLEERGLFWILAMRQPWVRVVAVTRRPVDPVTVEYYLSLLPDPEDARARLTLISLDDASDTRPLAALVLDRPEVVDRLRAAVGDDPTAAMVMPFNVTEQEQDLALAIGAPIYGIEHRFARYGRKSEGRRLFGDVGVACAPGVEDVRSADDVAAAIATLRPSGEVVVKLDDSVYGEGNARLQPGADPRALPVGYLADLRRLGGVVETWLDGDEVASPSVQLRIRPGGEALVIATHDQMLGGENGQQFTGGRFPASGAYHHKIVAPARRVAERLAAEGAVGRFGIDFVVVRGPDGTWQAYAMELNLREGGTSHPYGTLWLLTEGNFDADAGAFRLADGTRRVLVASDNVPVGADNPETVLAASRATCTNYDSTTTTGTVFHMFAAVAAEGRISAVTIGTSHADASQRHERMTTAIK
jgi:hypothetical protein